jgi:hypothetical protein
VILLQQVGAVNSVLMTDSTFVRFPYFIKHFPQCFAGQPQMLFVLGLGEMLDNDC